MGIREWLIKILQTVVKSSLLREGLKTLSAMVLLAAVLAGIVFGATSYGVLWGVKKEPVRPEISGFSVATVRNGTIDEYYETSGTIKAKEIQMITAKLEGKITTVNAKPGDQVTAGQVLMTLDDGDINQQMQAVSMAQQAARRQLEIAHEQLAQSGGLNQRYKTLFDVHAVARKEQEKVQGQYDEAAAAVAQAQSRVDQTNAAMARIRDMLEKTRLQTAISGVVTEQKAGVGNNILPGTPLMTVEDQSFFYVEGQVDGELAGRLSPGQKVLVSIGNGSPEEAGQIASVTPAPDSSIGMYVVKASFAGTGAKSGTSGTMKVPASQREALLAPAAAIVTKDGQTGAYVLRPDMVIAFRPVRLVGGFEQQVEILEGLYPGEEVIVDGVERAVDGGVARDVRSQ